MQFNELFPRKSQLLWPTILLGAFVLVAIYCAFFVEGFVNYRGQTYRLAPFKSLLLCLVANLALVWVWRGLRSAAILAGYVVAVLLGRSLLGIPQLDVLVKSPLALLALTAVAGLILLMTEGRATVPFAASPGGTGIMAGTSVTIATSANPSSAEVTADDPRGAGWRPSSGRMPSSTPTPAQGSGPALSWRPTFGSGSFTGEARNVSTEGFLLQRYDGAGNPLPPLPVKFRGTYTGGSINERDRVVVDGRWTQRRGGVVAKRIHDLTTGTVMKAHTMGMWGQALVVFGAICGFVLFIYESQQDFSHLANSSPGKVPANFAQVPVGWEIAAGAAVVGMVIGVVQKLRK